MSAVFQVVGCVLGVVACTPETTIRPDADPNSIVKTIDCSGVTPAVTITTFGLNYEPMMSELPVDGVARFELPPQHDVTSETSGLSVGFGGTACLQFPIAGSYEFQCESHHFVGSIVVE